MPSEHLHFSCHPRPCPNLSCALTAARASLPLLRSTAALPSAPFGHPSHQPALAWVRAGGSAQAQPGLVADRPSSPDIHPPIPTTPPLRDWHTGTYYVRTPCSHYGGGPATTAATTAPCAVTLILPPPVSQPVRGFQRDRFRRGRRGRRGRAARSRPGAA